MVNRLSFSDTENSGKEALVNFSTVVEGVEAPGDGGQPERLESDGLG